MSQSKREAVLSIVQGETPDIIPTIAEAFMDVTVSRALGYRPDGDPVRDQIALAELLKKNDTSVGVGVRSKDVVADAVHRIYEYETGARWEERYEPTFCREAIKYPVEEPSDIGNLRFPDPNDQDRYTGIDRAVEELHGSGYFVQGGTGGFWSGSYYFCTSFENILLWMATEPDLAEHIFAKVGGYVMGTAEQLLQRNVDSIFIYDDLGTGSSLLFSQQMYRRFIFPWHRKLADLCHSKGKLLHLHSHGHIQDVVDDIVEAGVDILNPVGPSDHNDLAYFADTWGEQITLLGGISTTVAGMGDEEINQHVAEVMKNGRRSPRFMPRTESGIPMMPPEKAQHLIDTEYRLRCEYGAGG